MINVTTQAGSNPTMELFTARAAEDCRFIRYFSWPTAALLGDLEKLEPRLLYTGSDYASAYGSYRGCLVLVGLCDGQLTTSVAANAIETISQALQGLRNLFPEYVPKQSSQVPLYLWTMTDQGPRKIRRVIDVPRWDEIAANYAPGTRAHLDRLMSHRPDEGKILIWDGAPGTGKTFALRSLASEWRSWCEMHYIVDPEIMFGSKSQYLIEVLLDSNDTPSMIIPAQVHVNGALLRQPEEKWRLLVLEDTGEMLTVDAKENVGQGLARLLNVTDGLIGQGMRIMVLVTTNEELGKLHPAITRPGRCAGAITFKPLPGPQASAWLHAHGIEDRPGDTTLAHLYAIAGGYEEARETHVAGFRVS